MFEAFGDAVALLKKYAILTITKPTRMARIHRLVQQVSRLRNGDNEVDCLRKAITTVNKYQLIDLNHAVVIWSYAIKHFELIDEFYFQSKYHEDFAYTPLHLFVYFENYEAADALLKIVDCNPSLKPKILNCVDRSNKTPLILAMNLRSHNLSQLLYKHDEKVHGDKHLLKEALACDDWGIVTTIIENGLDSNAVDAYVYSVLNYAIYQNQPNFVKFLIEKGVDVTVAYNNCDAIDKNDLEQLKILIKNCADVNAKHSHGVTSLHLAVYMNRLEIAKLLIEGGADVNALQYYGETLLQHAISENRLEIAKFLVESGADVNITHDRNWTLLHSATQYNYSDMVQLLIEKGADVNALFITNETLLEYAISENKMDIAKILEEKGATVSSTFDRVNFSRHRGRTPLYYAHWRRYETSLWSK